MLHNYTFLFDFILFFFSINLRATNLQSEFQNYNKSNGLHLAYCVREYITDFSPSNGTSRLNRAKSIIALLKLIALTDQHKHLLNGEDFPYFIENEFEEKMNEAFRLLYLYSFDDLVKWLKDNAYLSKRVLT